MLGGIMGLMGTTFVTYDTLHLREAVDLKGETHAMTSQQILDDRGGWDSSVFDTDVAPDLFVPAFDLI